MEINLIFYGVIAIIAIILIVYVFKKNAKDKKEVTKFFNEEIKSEKKFKFDDDDEL